MTQLTDMFGNGIKPGESYFSIQGNLVHVDAVEDYLIEVLHAEVHENKNADYLAE